MSDNFVARVNWKYKNVAKDTTRLKSVVSLSVIKRSVELN
jgi:hypothetical protein